MSDPVAPFRALYANRHAAAKAWKARTGGKVVGYVGADVPDELITAAGMLAVRVVGEPGSPTTAVDPYVEATADPGVKSIAARLMDPTYAYLDHLVISVTPTIYGVLHNFFVEMRRLYPDMKLPEPYLFDFFHSRYRTTSLFNRQSLEMLRDRLAAWSGSPITDSALEQAIALTNENRALLAEMTALRSARPPRLSGVDALQIIGTSFTTPQEDHNRLLKALLENAEDLPAAAGLPVIYSGSETETLAPYQAIEAAGAVIVADDQEWGSRAVETPIDESLAPMDAICDRYQFRSPQAAGRTAKDRQAYLAELVGRQPVGGVVFHIQAIDHPSSWDYPRLRNTLDALGVACIELGPRLYNDVDREGLTGLVSRFVAEQSRTVAA